MIDGLCRLALATSLLFVLGCEFAYVFTVRSEVSGLDARYCASQYWRARYGYQLSPRCVQLYSIYTAEVGR